jgi:hypothetical protein
VQDGFHDTGLASQFGHAVFQSCRQLAEFLVHAITIRDIPGYYSGTAGGCRALADIDKKLAAVAAPRQNVPYGTHGTGGRTGFVFLAGSGVGIAELHREQDLQRLADQFLPGIAEHSLGFGIDPNDPAFGRDYQDSVGRRLDYGLKIDFNRIISQARRETRDLRSPAAQNANRPHYSPAMCFHHDRIRFCRPELMPAVRF